MLQSTLRQTLSDRLWQNAQDRDASFIAAQNAARTSAATVAGILAGYDFAHDEYNTLKSANGALLQVAMRVVSKTDINDRYLVIAKAHGSEIEWMAYCPPFQQGNGPLFIQAVKTRINAKRQQEGKPVH